MAKKIAKADGVIYSNLEGRAACSIAELCTKAPLLQENEDHVKHALAKMCQDGIVAQVGCNFMLKENLFSSKVKQQRCQKPLLPVKDSVYGEEFPPLSSSREIVRKRPSRMEGNREMTPRNRDKEVMQYGVESSKQSACEQEVEHLSDTAISTGAQPLVHHHNYSIVHNHYYTQIGNNCKIYTNMSQDTLRKN